MTKLVSTNPAKNYEEIGSVDVSTEQEIIDAVNRANNAKDTWRELGLKIARLVEAGGLKVGESAPFSREMPFGGYKDSGMGREHGVIGMRQLCQIKSISLSK